MTAIGGETRLRLFPITVTASADRFLVTRRDTGTILQTSESGVDSILFLRRGLTIDRTRAAIGEKYGCPAAEVDIMPLVESLLGAGFIEAIDGRVVAARQTGVGRILRGLYAAYVLTPALSFVIRRAPLGWTLRLILRHRPGRDPVVTDRIAANLRRVPALAQPDDQVGRVAADNLAALRLFYYERMLLAALPPARLDRWMRQWVDIDGLEHLDRARAGQRGVILCGFHLAGYSVVPFALASRGYAQMVMMAATADSTREILARVSELQRAGLPYRIEPVPAEGHTRRVMRGLLDGAVVLLLADPTPGRPSGGVSAPFLGGSLRLSRGVAWLARRASAVVLPVFIRSSAPGRYRLQIAAPVETAAQDMERATIEMLAAGLEREVLDRPAEWLKWHDLYLMAGDGAPRGQEVRHDRQEEARRGADAGSADAGTERGQRRDHLDAGDPDRR